MRALDPAQALAAYRERGTLREAARALKCCEASVWRALVECGVPRARTGPRRAPELEQRITRAVELARCYADAGAPLSVELLARWAQLDESLLRASLRNRITMRARRLRARRAHG